MFARMDKALLRGMYWGLSAMVLMIASTVFEQRLLAWFLAGIAMMMIYGLTLGFDLPERRPTAGFGTAAKNAAIAASGVIITIIGGAFLTPTDLVQATIALPHLHETYGYPAFLGVTLASVAIALALTAGIKLLTERTGS